MTQGNKRGFTFLELIIVAALSMFLIGAAITISLAGRRSFEIGDALILLQQELRRGESLMVGEFHEGGQATISNVPADGDWYTQIDFKIPMPGEGGVSEGRIVWDSTPIQYLLGGTGGTQLLRNDQNGQSVLANDISSFRVRRQTNSPYVVEVALIGEKTTIVGDTVTADLNFSVKLRN